MTELVESQFRYLSLLTLDPKQRQEVSLKFSELEESIEQSGKEILTLLYDSSKIDYETKLQNRSKEYLVEFWVVVLQILNYAAECREQVNHMMRVLGIRPPILDVWSYGKSKNAVVPVHEQHILWLSNPIKKVV